MELLQIFIPTSIALTAVFIAIRGKYIQDFRTYGLDFFANWRLYKASNGRKIAREYKEIAKSRIIHSLQYECRALFLTFSIVYMFLAFIFSLLAILSAIIPIDEIILLSAILFPVLYFVKKTWFWTFSIAYIFFAFIFSLTAILYAIIPLDEIILVPAFYFAIIAFCVLFFEERLHSPKGKLRKIGFIFLNPYLLVSLILKETPFGIQYLSPWKEIKDQFEIKDQSKYENDEINKLKEFIEKGNDYFIQPLREYNLLPWNVCSYCSCKIRIKLRPCRYCEKKFCEKHLPPKNPMRPPIKGKPKEMDDRRKDGHPCPKYPPYLKLKEKEELDKR